MGRLSVLVVDDDPVILRLLEVNFQLEGIDCAHRIRATHPETGVVVLSAHDDEAYALALLGQGHSGLAYLLKDRVAEGDELTRAIREVADYLGNTPAVARTSYVDPRVLDRFLEGETIGPALGGVSPDDLSDPAIRQKVERAVLELIESAPHAREQQAA